MCFGMRGFLDPRRGGANARLAHRWDGWAGRTLGRAGCGWIGRKIQAGPIVCLCRAEIGLAEQSWAGSKRAQTSRRGPPPSWPSPAEGRRTRLQLENQFLGHFCPENRSWKEKFILQNRLFISFLFLLRSVVWARRKRGEARLLWLDYFVSCCSVDVFFISLCAGPRMEGVPREPLAWVRNRPCRC